MALQFRCVDLAAGIKVHSIEVDRNSEIHPNFSHRFTEVREGTFGIRARVADYYKNGSGAAPSPKDRGFRNGRHRRDTRMDFGRSLGPRLHQHGRTLLSGYPAWPGFQATRRAA